MSTNEEKLKSFFSRTSVTIDQCNIRALSLTSGPLVPVHTQGRHSYTLYATPTEDTIVQFRLESDFIDLDKYALVKKVHGTLVPWVSFEGEMGTEEEQGQAVCVYLMGRARGVSLQELFGNPQAPPLGSGMNLIRRQLLKNLTSFVAQGWKPPQPVGEPVRREMQTQYGKDLQKLRQLLDNRFTPIIDACLSSLDYILGLPFSLQHPGLSASNIFIDTSSYQITGIIGWSRAEIRPFGMDIHKFESLVACLGEGFGAVGEKGDEGVVWETLRGDIDDLRKETEDVVKNARVLGVLLDRGLERRLDGGSEVADVHDVQRGSGRWWLEMLLIDEKDRIFG